MAALTGAVGTMNARFLASVIRPRSCRTSASPSAKRVLEDASAIQEGLLGKNKKSKRTIRPGRRREG